MTGNSPAFNRNYPVYIPQSVIDLVNRDFPASCVNWPQSLPAFTLKGLRVWEALIHEPGMTTVWEKINEIAAQEPKYNNLAVAIMEAARIAAHDYEVQQAEAVELAKVLQKIQDQAEVLRKSIDRYKRLAGTPHSHVLKSRPQIVCAEKIFEILEQSDGYLKRISHLNLLATATEERDNHITAALSTRQRSKKNDFLRGFLYVLIANGIEQSYQLTEKVIATVASTVLGENVEPDPAEIRRLWNEITKSKS